MIIKCIITDDNNKEHALGITRYDVYTQEKWERLIEVFFNCVQVKIRQLKDGIDEPWPRHL